MVNATHEKFGGEISETKNHEIFKNIKILGRIWLTINGNIEQFLDAGWMTEATLFYKGKIYWFEVWSEASDIVFFVDCWEAINEDNLYYHSILNKDKTLDWKRVLEIKGNDLDLIKKQFLESPIFENKTFWQVEKELAWLDESSPIIKE